MKESSRLRGSSRKREEEKEGERKRDEGSRPHGAWVARRCMMNTFCSDGHAMRCQNIEAQLFSRLSWTVLMQASRRAHHTHSFCLACAHARVLRVRCTWPSYAKGVLTASWLISS
jgi:hypothetical protein